MPSPGEMIAQQAPYQNQGMPQMGGPAPEQKNAVPGEAASNPIIEAMRTMMTVVAAKQEQGDPNANEMQDLLRRFTSLLAGGVEQGQAQQQGNAPPPQGAQIPVGRQGADQMIGNMGQQAMSINKGQVPVM